MITLQLTSRWTLASHGWHRNSQRWWLNNCLIVTATITEKLLNDTATILLCIYHSAKLHYIFTLVSPKIFSMDTLNFSEFSILSSRLSWGGACIFTVHTYCRNSMIKVEWTHRSLLHTIKLVRKSSLAWCKSTTTISKTELIHINTFSKYKFYKEVSNHFSKYIYN